MTTPPVMSITDEQIAEIEQEALRKHREPLEWFVYEPSYVLALITRLREAEVDAKRYRWLCASAWYVGPEPRGDTEAVSWHDHNETKDGVTEAIDAAMERTP